MKSFSFSLLCTISNYFRILKKDFNYAKNKILSIRFNFSRLFYLIIFLLPFIQTELRIRIGAGWQLYIPLIFLLFFSLMVKINKFKNFVFLTIILFISMLFSNIYGYYLINNFYSLSMDQLQQIQSIEAVMSVETFRWIACIMFFSITLFMTKNLLIYLKALRIFIFSVFFQALYGIYELIVKLYLSFLPLLNIKAYSHDTFRVFGTFFEPSQYGLFILVGITIFAYYLSLLKRINYQIQYDLLFKYQNIIFIILIIALFLSLSRAAMLIGIVLLLINFLISLFRANHLIKNLFIISFIAFFAYLYLFVFLDDNKRETWFYLLTSNEGNGLFARIYLVINDMYEFLILFFYNFLGTGQGTAIILEQGMVPFIFRFFLENGFFISISYLFFIFTIIRRAKKRHYKFTKKTLLISLITICLIQFNYNSTTDPWIWFLFALLYNSYYFNLNYSNINLSKLEKN